MITDLIYIAIALALLFAGAESLVKGSASLALRVGLSQLMVGLTVVAFGTSSPELVVSLKAALSQQGDLAVGNVVGSNTFNIAVILGLTALVCPIAVRRQIIRVDAPIALLVAVALLLSMLDDVLGRIGGALLFAGIIAYTLMNLAIARRQGGESSPEAADAAVQPVSRHLWIDLVLIVGGLAVLVFGSRLLVEHSVSLAQELGISEAVIGLTIVAAGTSMPELATSLVAAVRQRADIAIGNVVGSNVFNILGILGLASIVSPISAPGISSTDYLVMVAFSALMIPLLYTGRFLHRLEGGFLLALYGVYLFTMWPQ